MKRLGCSSGLAALLVTSLLATAAGRFDQKLSTDKQAIHVLNRMTFGPRPGDVDQVRKMTVEKWIDLQLHPDRIAENPILEAKLKPLQTLQLATWELLQKYPPAPPATTTSNRMMTTFFMYPSVFIMTMSSAPCQRSVSILPSRMRITRLQCSPTSGS